MAEFTEAERTTAVAELLDEGHPFHCGRPADEGYLLHVMQKNKNEANDRKQTESATSGQSQQPEKMDVDGAEGNKKDGTSTTP